ncbi:MAG TPA: serine hydrolase domain-containing protein [Acidimicrobiales bacterium]|nr:serine hydrolase domain-containing protein [Acidimicrobiales bacterium]
MPSLPAGLDGTCDERFLPVANVVARQIDQGAHHGCAVAIRHRGKPVADFWGGRRGTIGDPAADRAWTSDTMALSYSTTKGVAATALHMVLERTGVALDTPVGEIWPEYTKDRSAAKATTTIRHVLCHEAGVPQIHGEIPDVTSMADWSEMVALMERLEPLWEPGTQNGYHAVNFGWLVGELVRRIDGRTIDAFIAEEIAGPLACDGLFVGTPASEHHRVAPVIQPPGDPSAMEALLPPDHLLRRALAPEGDMFSFVNSPEGLQTVAPAWSGVFTARSLATMYGALANGGEIDGTRLLLPESVATAATVQNRRPDLVLFVPIHWRLGFMGGGSMLSPTGPNPESFGHAGLGGSVAFADPKAELSFAIVLDRLELDLLAGERVRAAVHAAVAAATS